MESQGSLGRAAIKSRFLALVAAAGVALTIVGVHELLVLFGAGVIVGSGRLRARQIGTRHSLLLPISGSPVAFFLQASTAAIAPFGLWPLFLFFLKVGSVLYGSGYVLLAFMRSDLVERWRWLTETQLLDAIAVGQVTPGPVFTTATFVGYVLDGTRGALVATLEYFCRRFSLLL